MIAPYNPQGNREPVVDDRASQATTEVSGRVRGAFGSFDLTHVLLTVLIAMCFGVTWWGGFEHERAEARREGTYLAAHKITQTLIAELVATNRQLAIDLANSSRAHELTLAILKDSFVEGAEIQAYVLSLEPAQRKALNLSVPKSLRDRTKKPRVVVE